MSGECSDVLIHRATPRDNYTVVSNRIFDTGLGVEALGLLTYLISRPANWRVSQEQLRKQFRIGRDRLSRIIKELEGAGYVERKQQRCEETQSFGKMEFHVYDQPIEGEDTGSTEEEAGSQASGGEPVPEKPSTAEPLTGDPTTGEPLTANQQVTSNNNIKNNYNNKSPLPPKRSKRRRRRDEGTLVPPERQRVFVEQYSPQWDAWVKYRGHAIPTGNSRDPETGRYMTGWWFDTLWPPDCAEGS